MAFGEHLFQLLNVLLYALGPVEDDYVELVSHLFKVQADLKHICLHLRT